MAKKNTTPISQHIFLFPFRIEKWKGAKREEFLLRDVFLKLTGTVWEYESFSPFESNQNYNEYSYFFDYVRTALFERFKRDTEKDGQKKSIADQLFIGKEPQFVSCLLQRRNQNGVFELQIKDQPRPYKLMIDGISLRLFETGIAILAIELLNYEYSEVNDILRINDSGRRVYPQFLGNPPHEINDAKSAFLADNIRFKIENNEPIAESFQLDDFFNAKHQRPYHLHIGKHITDLMGEEFASHYRMDPIIDDRMFTVCWYRGDDLLENLTKPSEGGKYGSRPEYPFESSENWYRFIFVDGNDCCCPDEFSRRNLIKATTYTRWNQYHQGSTLYGLSRYSLICLSKNKLFRIHTKRLYRLMAEILLAQQASIITFFNRVANISKEIDQRDESKNEKGRQQKEKQIEDIIKEIRKLNRDFLGFKNRLWFVEVTPQEQGIEMYEMAMKNMKLEKQMEELKDEIKELYEYSEMQYNRIRANEEKKLNNQMFKLTKIAAFTIPIAIVLAFWGISFDFIKTTKWENFLNFIIIKPAIINLSALTVGLVGLLIFFLMRWVNKEKKEGQAK